MTASRPARPPRSRASSPAPGAHRIVVAMPVAAPDSLAELAAMPEVDEVVCLSHRPASWRWACITSTSRRHPTHRSPRCWRRRAQPARGASADDDRAVVIVAQDACAPAAPSIRPAAVGRLPIARLDDQDPSGAEPSSADAATRRCTSSPSPPPSSATRASWSRASGGMSAISSVGTYGAFTASMSTVRAGRRGAARRGRPRTPSPPRFEIPPRRANRGRVDVCGDEVDRPATSAISAPIAPMPQHRSTTTGGAPPRVAARSRTRRAATLARNSVRWRGNEHTGFDVQAQSAEVRPAEHLFEGSPATRRATSASSASSSAVAPSRRRSLILGEDATAARSRSTRSASARPPGSVGGACSVGCAPPADSGILERPRQQGAHLGGEPVDRTITGIPGATTAIGSTATGEAGAPHSARQPADLGG